MNIWIAILGFFASGITCFAIGIRVSMWGQQSRGEDKSTLDRWMELHISQTEKLNIVTDLYYKLIAEAALNIESIDHPDCIKIRTEIDRALTSFNPYEEE